MLAVTQPGDRFLALQAALGSSPGGDPLVALGGKGRLSRRDAVLIL